MIVNYQEARENIVDCIKAKLVAMVHGSPAIGKSSVVQDIAREYNLYLIDMRLAEADPTDLLGFPKIDPETNRASYAPMETFPIEGDRIPDGYSGWLVLLDEFTSAPRAVQAAAYKVVLDRKIGLKRLHDRVAVVAAGNKSTDRAIVEELSTAMQSRLVHMELAPNLNQWLDWAMQQNIDYRITSYLQFKPDQFYAFKPDHTDLTYAAPRTWAMLDKLIKVRNGTIDRKRLSLYAGTIGEGTAREFLAYIDVYKELPTVDQIIQSPLSLPVSSEPSVLFAISGTIANHMEASNAAPLMNYVERLPVEFQIVTVKEALRRCRDLLQEPRLQQWIASSSRELF